jgi:formylglycine-generating enzyme required for sulfatase activity
VYAWGDELDETKYYFETKADTSIPINQPVGSHPEGASPYEVLDMTGGVFEWVSDWYSETYYAESPSSNPEGPLSGDNHVIRGGDYVDFDISTFTRYGPPARGYFNSIKDLGFRCAADVEQ